MRLVAGGETAWRALVRADAPSQLTETGWQDLRAHGVATIIDLRHEHERDQGADSSPGREGIETVYLPLEDLTDTQFWERWTKFTSCPMYYKPFLERSPSRVGDIFSAIANAGPGGLLFHCVRGRDRTGLISLLLLALAGVEPDDIAEDYRLSGERLRREAEQEEIDRLLTEHNTTARHEILSLLASMDVAAYLVAAGVSGHDMTKLRARLAGENSVFWQKTMDEI